MAWTRSVIASQFSYRATVYPINIPVNPSIYRAAVSSGNKHLRLGNATTLELYNKILTDPAMEPVYAAILRELRNALYKGGYTLTDDEYLELLVSFVQQIA